MSNRRLISTKGVIMAIDSIGANFNQVRSQKDLVSFDEYSDRLNNSIPQVTTTVEQKRKAIAIKKQIMAHPACPLEVKQVLLNEIKIIQNEINGMSSVFS